MNNVTEPEINTIHSLLEAQKAFFKTKKTYDIKWRREQLKKLRAGLKSHEEEMTTALSEDLGRHPAETYLTDIGPALAEIDECIGRVSRWARTETHFSGPSCFPSIITKVYKIPYGTVLIISPFNFPIVLSLGVLAYVLAAGNTAVIKASSKSPASTAALKKMLTDIFPEEYVTVIVGGHDTADMCLSESFDKIFYTGSPAVGKHVLRMAAENLIPVGLELGGETGNWCIVRKDADLKDAARKTAFIKACNSGQICININQVAVATEAADDFIDELKTAFTSQLGENPIESAEYPRMIDKTAFDRCIDTLENYRDRIVFGGGYDRESLKIAPTVIYPVDKDEEIVRRELFSPLLPIVPYKDNDIEALIETIEGREHGLSLYIFTKDLKWAKDTMAKCQYGGGGINEVIMQMMVRGVPFNGTGHSGMGAYHGEWGFREFSHPSTVVIGNSILNLPLREHPYTGRLGKLKSKLIRFFER